MLWGMRVMLSVLVFTMLLEPGVLAADRHLQDIECSRRYEAEIRQAWGGLFVSALDNASWAQSREAGLRQAEWNLQDCLRETPPAEVRLSLAMPPVPAQPAKPSAIQLRGDCSGFLKLMCP